MIRRSALVIVESPTKAKTICKYLNSIEELCNKYIFNVIACCGHICDLPLKKLGINTDTWEVTYENKKEIVAKLRKAAKESDKIYLCSDLDMEGHAISFHLRNILKLTRNDYHRVTFNEITKSALKTAFLNPGDINMQMVNAQETRRILDRIVGYKLSPLLWQEFSQSKLSAGRVQSAALNIIVQRSEDIKNHIAELYWNIYGTFILSDNFTINAKLEREYRISTEEEVRTILLELKDIEEWSIFIEKKQSKKNPPMPFITSSLQQEVYKRYHISAKKTMIIAQNLYELGLITYMRTDSMNLSEDCRTAIHNYLSMSGSEIAASSNFGEGAHEAIHPTDINKNDIESLGISNNDKKIYDLIWRRTVASQMTPAIYTDIYIKIIGKKYIFLDKISVLKDKGFLKIYSPEIELRQEIDMCSSNNIPIAVKFNAIVEATRANSLYNESSLIKTLEKENIGRPSTYASIIDKIQEKGYIKLGQNPQTILSSKNYEIDLKKKIIDEEIKEIHIGGNETDRMIPTELGIKVINYLKLKVPYIIDPKFTSEMENNLDDIANNKKEKVIILNEFYSKFKESVPDIISSSSNIIKEFPDISCNIVNTKYGAAIFHNKKFYNLKSYLEWKKLEIKDITQEDITFIISLPITIKGTNRSINIGQYGLYLIEKKRNIKLPVNLWDKVRNGIITKEEINAV